MVYSSLGGSLFSPDFCFFFCFDEQCAALESGIVFFYGSMFVLTGLKTVHVWTPSVPPTGPHTGMKLSQLSQHSRWLSVKIPLRKSVSS